MVWNTGARGIANGLADGLSILDLEDTHHALSVEKGGVKDWASVIFPWCDNRKEVENKAFRVSSLVTGKTGIYLFQEFKTNKICWSPAQDPWDARQVLRNGRDSPDELQPLPNIDVYILADRVWGVPASNANNVLQQVLDESIAIIGAVGTIASLFKP